MSDKTLNDIKSAYKKFKSYIYYDNSSLYTKIRLAKFESSNNFEEKLSKLNAHLDDFTENEDSLNEYIEKISYVLIPKKFKNKENSKEDKNIYTNKISYDSYELDDFNIFIDCPIEIHIISILWIMKVGHELDKKLSNNIKGDRLHRNKDNNFENNKTRLFKKYHEQYIEFRDSIIKKATNLHKEELDVTLINLDVKSFYYNIKFDFFDDKLPESKFNSIMNLIHKKYQDILDSNIIQFKKIKKENILPIGLLSSKIIANYVLKEFDKKVCKDLKPAIYSRYVDDMLLVIINNKDDTMEYLSEKLDLTLENKTYKFKTENNHFIFQNSKVKIFHFLKKESIYLLNKFSKTITNNSSIFNLLPNDENIFNTLEEESYKINYESSINTISSISGDSLDKLNISKNISQMTRIALNTNYDKSKILKYNKQIENLFSGSNILELRNLWEKVFTYLYISKSNKEFINIFRKIIEIILNIEIELNEKLSKKIRIDLLKHLINSITLSITLSKENFNKNLKKYLDDIYDKNNISKFIDYMINNDINDNSNNILKTNLLRHYLIQVPLVSYCNNNKVNYINRETSFDNFNFEIDNHKIEYSPKFIHYHEVTNFFHLEFLYKNSNNIIKENTEDFIFKKYQDFNSFNKNNNYPQKKDSSEEFYIHKITSGENKNKLRIGVVNIKVDAKNSLESFLGKPNLSFKRLFEIHQVLNLGKKNNCDILIFPEISIPHQYLNLIIDFSKKNDIAFILGLEHISIDKTVFNYTTVILPFKDGKYQNIYVDYILKKYYSPEETEEIEGRYYNIPDKRFKKEKIDIYNWKGMFFSVFNCFELTNIITRSKLVGKNDFTIAIEYNKDVNYFSNIVESMSRDNHVYMIQVNNSMYGDSRITQPSKTEIKDIIKIKGGENISLIVGEIDIKKLREFQSKKPNLQKKDKTFKPTPPDFYKEMFKERKV